MLWWRYAGITLQMTFHTGYTIWRRSYGLDGTLVKEKVVIDGSSHCVIKSSVSNLKSRGRRQKTSFLLLSQSIP